MSVSGHSEAQEEPAAAAARAGDRVATGDLGGDAATAAGRSTAARLLALQGRAGNRAVGRLLRQQAAAFKPAVTGTPNRPAIDEEKIYREVKSLLSSTFLFDPVTDGDAESALWQLGHLPDDALGRVVMRLEADGLIDVLLEELPAAKRRSLKLIQILGKRPVHKNKGMVKKYLDNWLVTTDDDAEAAAALIEALPPEDRKVMYESWYGKELRENLPGSANYEDGIGTQLLEGALIGDFKEDQSFWNIAGQVATGFIPYAGQVADMRDTVAALDKLDKNGWTNGWDWANLLLTLVAWVPGLGDLVGKLGKAGMKWLRAGGRKLIGAFFGSLTKRVLEPALKAAVDHVLKPLVGKVRKAIDDVVARIRKAMPAPAAATPAPAKAAPPAAATPPATPAKTDTAASKAAREVLEKEVDDALGKVAKETPDAVGTLVERLVLGFVDKLKVWAAESFPQWFKKIYVALEGDWIVVYGVASKVKVVKARPKAVKEYVLKQTETLKALVKDRTKALTKARASGVAAAEDALRKQAIDVTEEIGEYVADILIRRQFAGSTVNRLYTGSGSGVLDLVYKVDGRLVVVEAKGGASRLGFRTVGSESVQQGTLKYLDDILDSMIKKGGADKKIAEQVQAARAAREVDYFIAKSGRVPESAAPLKPKLLKVPAPS